MVVQCKYCKYFRLTGIGQDGNPNPCGGLCEKTLLSKHEGVDACGMFETGIKGARMIVCEANEQLLNLHDRIAEIKEVTR